MLQTITKIVKYASLPALLVGSALPFYSVRYESAVNVVVCLGAILVAYRSVRLEEYFWAAGWVAVAVVFSPLLLSVKIFLLMGLACIVIFATLVAAFRKQPPLESQPRRFANTPSRLPGNPGTVLKRHPKEAHA